MVLLTSGVSVTPNWNCAHREHSGKMYLIHVPCNRLVQNTYSNNSVIIKNSIYKKTVFF
jgi:hypothetical protein